jgi:hypothetical protein
MSTMAKAPGVALEMIQAINTLGRRAEADRSRYRMDGASLSGKAVGQRRERPKSMPGSSTSPA